MLCLSVSYGSKAIPHGPFRPVDVPEIVLKGGTLPFAVLPYIVMELPPVLDTIITLFAVSTAIPLGLYRPVDKPEIVLKGATLPFAVLLYTVIESKLGRLSLDT